MVLFGVYGKWQPDCREIFQGEVKHQTVFLFAASVIAYQKSEGGSPAVKITVDRVLLDLKRAVIKLKSMVGAQSPGIVEPEIGSKIDPTAVL